MYFIIQSYAICRYESDDFLTHSHPEHEELHWTKISNNSIHVVLTVRWRKNGDENDDMNIRKIQFLSVLGTVLFVSSIWAQYATRLDEPRIVFAPRSYLCYHTSVAPVIDGQLDEQEWSAAPWSESFVDIQGDLLPVPRWSTKVKMLWDKDRFYIAAEIEDPHVWARLMQRDTVIFYDNDFEVFIDPDGDTHQYYEFEMNALNTGWDLLLIKPYRDGGPAVHGWDIQGLKTAVSVQGTLNQPNDVDKGWTVELAVPWPALRECSLGNFPPKPGDQWRINFSRVEWKTEIKTGRYAKCINPLTGKPFPEENWVWSPQGLINMHYPEMWGYVKFSDLAAGTSDRFVMHPEEKIKWMLRQIYYRERNYHVDNNRYTARWDELKLDNTAYPGYHWPPLIICTPSVFEVRLVPDDDQETWCIRQDGLIWKELKKKDYDSSIEMEGGKGNEMLPLEYALLVILFIGTAIFARIAAKKRFDV
jgi:hypothetical protein